MKQWDDYTIYARALSNMFKPLDRFYLAPMGGMSVIKTAHEMFRVKLFQKNLEPFRNAILEEIRKGREPEIVDTKLIKNAISHFIIIDYKSDNELKIVKSDNDFVWKGTKSLNLYNRQFVD